MKARLFSLFLVVAALFLPVAVFAQAPQNFYELVRLFIDLIATLVPIVAGIALLVFFYGLAKFIKNAGSSDAQSEGRQVMMWGIIALFVMVSVWGLVAFLKYDLFGSTDVGIPLLPTK